MWIDHASPLALLQLIRETMDTIQGRANSPSPDKVTSAADAMLRLSSSGVVDPALVHASVAHAQAQRQMTMVSPNSHSVTSPAAGMQVCMREDGQVSTYTRNQRKQREFIPENRKDILYWNKRRKNNAAAKRSREKRKVGDMQLKSEIRDLSQENARLQMEMSALKHKYGWPTDKDYPFDGEVPVVQPRYFSNSDSESSNASFTSGSYVSRSNQMSCEPSIAGPGPEDITKIVTDGIHNPHAGSIAQGPSQTLPSLRRESSSPASQQMPMLLPLVPSHVPGLIPSNITPALSLHTDTMSEGRMAYQRPPHDNDSDLPPPPLHIYPTGGNLPFPLPLPYHGTQDAGRLRRMPESPGHSNSSSSPELKINLSNSGSEVDSFNADTSPQYDTSRHEQLDAHTGESHYYGNLARVVESNRGSGRKGVPFKLWHKISNSESQKEPPRLEGDDHGMDVGERNGIEVGDDTQMTVTSTSSESSKVGTANQYLDPRYLERRKKKKVPTATLR